MELRIYTHYVNGAIGHDFKLSMLQRLKILFCGKVSVFVLSDTVLSK